MKELQVIQYSSEKKKAWDTFVEHSKNGTFLFYRDFMEYHYDRFDDFSLMVYEQNKLLALLPANRSAETVFSHQGLTYGGMVLSKKIKFEKIERVFSALLQFLAAENVRKLRLKLIPKIYSVYPSDEMEYLLFLTKSKLYRRQLWTCIPLAEKLPLQSNRKEGVRKAQKQGLYIEKTTDFALFWEKILIPNLAEKYDAKPVHTLSEIQHLANLFPENIRQFNVFNNEKIVGGATIFETEKVAHTQYISANDQRGELGTLDFLFQYLIKEQFSKKTYFDFGASLESNGALNKSLLYWKESFGGRGVAQDFYEVETENYQLLNVDLNSTT